MEGKRTLKIAVTGAAGFVGRYVLDALAKRGMETVAVVRDQAHAHSPLSASRIVAMDLSSAGADAYDRLGRPDVLIHLAWGGLPNFKSLHHIEHELPWQYRFLRDLVAAGLPSLVVTGTCFEYGMQSGPLSETNLTAPCNPYGFAKDTLRRQLQFLQAANPYLLTWARLFFVFGEGQAKGSIYPQLKHAVMQGDGTFDMSGGEQLRDYLPIEEAARQIVRLALARMDLGPVNVCSGVPVSMRSLVERWIIEQGWKITLNLGRYPYPDYEPMAFWGVRDRLDAVPDTHGPG